MLVPDFAISQSEAPYIGVPSSIKGTINATHGAGTKRQLQEMMDLEISQLTLMMLLIYMIKI